MSAKMTLWTALSSVLVSLATGCNPPEGREPDPEEGEVEERAAGVDQSTFYIVTRRDFRKCAFPMCGGYYVKRVNRDETMCADGVLAEECYVAEFDLEALKLDGAAREQFDWSLVGGHALVRGAIAQRTYGPDRVAGVLVAAEGWVGRAGSTPRGKFYRLRNISESCDKEPCPTVRATRLNTRWSRLLHGVELDQTGASQEARDEAVAAMAETPEGILAAGGVEVVGHEGHPLRSLIASEFYTRQLPSAGGKFCGGIAAFPCGERQVCDLDPGMCDGADIGGTCVLEPEFCPRIYRPVCGCNGRTYSNDCLRVMAGAQKARDGACR